MLVLTTSMPTPRPEKFVTFSAVEKPGQENEVDDLSLAHPRGLVGGDQALLHRLIAELLESMPGAIVGDLDD